MSKMQEAGRAGTRTGFRAVFVGTIDSSDHSPAPSALQATRLSRRFGLTPVIAAVLADLAFRVEARR